MDEHIDNSRGVVLRPSLLPTYERGGSARSTPLVGTEIGAKAFLNGMTVIGPGAAIPLHTHNCEESIVILEGEAIAEIDGAQHALRPFETSWVPADIPHRFINASDKTPLRILWTYGRTDATRTLVETGETRPVVAEHDRSRVPQASA
ncbi:cupin domain-containing protein (plasmid) [Lichenicola cladoniae]|uniref:Cupin domain-containing protein n=2 Tax=Lichenicola cladoniae TaxID=1484109 RepID=A0A6M8HXM3_9PROT|nr:cupin domain-containing protein [Acetobacteraceae bacterium]QKE93273.1 cupin domain-containing protein [Lichenicola cladoniae]